MLQLKNFMVSSSKRQCIVSPPLLLLNSSGDLITGSKSDFFQHFPKFSFKGCLHNVFLQKRKTFYTFCLFGFYLIFETENSFEERFRPVLSM